MNFRTLSSLKYYLYNIKVFGKQEGIVLWIMDIEYWCSLFLEVRKSSSLKDTNLSFESNPKLHVFPMQRLSINAKVFQ